MNRPKIFIIQIPVWLMFSYVLILPCLLSLQEKLPPGEKINPLNGLLIVFPILIITKIVTFLLINWFVFTIPKFRKQTEKWVEDNPGRPKYYESQKQLIKALIIAGPIGIVLIFIGMNL